MASRKRQRSASQGETDVKRTKEAHLVEDDEDSLESILAQIKAHEESEALAHQLQAEWNAGAAAQASSSASNGQSTGKKKGPIMIVLDNDDDEEGDEAVARRLAREWGTYDIDLTEPSSPILSSSVTNSQRKQSSVENVVSNFAKTPDHELAVYRDLFTQSRKCIKCNTDVPSPRGEVVFTPELPSPGLLSLLHAPCIKCKTNYCRGCFTPIPCPPSCKGKGKKFACPVLTCCTEIRTVALFETLGGFDRLYLNERASSETRARTATSKHGSKVGTVGPGGTGYGTGSAHQNYAKGKGRGKAVQDTHKTRAENMAEHWDELIVRMLTTVTDLLPSPYASDDKVYNILPHGSIRYLISLSQLPELLDDLLRNDSVTDWINRSNVYVAMLNLLRRMGECELTMEVLIGSRWAMRKSCGLEEWMWKDGNITWEMEGEVPVREPPLYAHFQKLTKQCKTFLAGAAHMFQSEGEGDEEAAETTIKATSLCGDIIAAQDDIERAMAIMGKDPSTVLRSIEEPTQASTSAVNSKGKGPDPNIALERTYARECERLAFEYVTMSQPAPEGPGLVYPTFNYHPDLVTTASASRNPKDRFHLIKELAVMATCLPTGIWVRVDDVRNDAIKVMIAGPEGTPYAGGLFEFDCFIPLQYPRVPPLMHLRTTGGGRVRFNPNLYEMGKVCLSLLGTWPGRPEEQWSSKSTLLQVFVSIQSMILIDLPYFNEPGRGKANPANKQSQAYNKQTSSNTIRWAILEWLKDENKNSLWKDVIISHFSVRKEKIRRCIRDWTTGNSSASADISGSWGWNPNVDFYAGKTVQALEEYDQGIQRIQTW